MANYFNTKTDFRLGFNYLELSKKLIENLMEIIMKESEMKSIVQGVWEEK